MKLSINFFNYPTLTQQNVTTKEWREIMLETSGRIFACGDMWDLKRKSLGGGIYVITAKRAELD